MLVREFVVFLRGESNVYMQIYEGVYAFEWLGIEQDFATWSF